MQDNRWIYILILVAGCFVSAFSQVLLKQASQKEYSKPIFQYFNWRVILGYFMFAGVVCLNIFLLKHIPMAVQNCVCESLPLVLSFIFGRIFFKEKISIWMIIGTVLIIAGLIVILV